MIHKYLWGWLSSSCFVLKTSFPNQNGEILRKPEFARDLDWSWEVELKLVPLVSQLSWHVFLARPPHRNIDYPMTCSNFVTRVYKAKTHKFRNLKFLEARLLHLLHVPALCREVAWVPWTSWKTHQYLAKWTLTIKGLHRRSISWKSS